MDNEANSGLGPNVGSIVIRGGELGLETCVGLVVSGSKLDGYKGIALMPLPLLLLTPNIDSM